MHGYIETRVYAWWHVRSQFKNILQYIELSSLEKYLYLHMAYMRSSACYLNDIVCLRTRLYMLHTLHAYSGYSIHAHTHAHTIHN